MEIIDKIRQRADIVRLARGYTTLKKHGQKYVGLCPLHKETEPSFTVDSEKQLFHCFGCGVGGDVFTLVMEKEKLSFPEAAKFLADRYNIKFGPPDIIPPKVERSILKLASRFCEDQESDGRLGHEKLSNIIGKWAEGKTSDKVFLFQLIRFRDDFAYCQDELRKWDKLDEISISMESDR